MNKTKKPLSETHPDLAKEAFGWNPSTITNGSHKSLQWKCKNDHFWNAIVSNRVRGRGCPYCSNHKLLTTFNDLATTHPELAKEAHGWDPKVVVTGTNKKLEWKCSQGHIWSAPASQRISKKSGCPYCINLKVISGFNDLQTTNPELAKQAHGWDPKTIIAGTNKKLEWKCSQGHIWRASANSRVGRGSNCPYCINQKLLIGFNDLQTTNPKLAKEAHGWDPKTIIAGTGKKLEWKCSQGHVWSISGSARILRNTGCPYCARYSLLFGFNDLQTTNPELAKEAHGWDPKTIIAGTNKKLEWKCSQGHIWTASGNSRISKKSGCPYCANTLLFKNFNDLATTHPELAKEAHGWDPKTIIAGTHKKFEWICSQGHVWNAAVNSRSGNKRNCPYCSNQKLLIGFNDLQTTNPELAKQAHGWDPKTIIAGTNKKLEWKCSQGHVWKANANSRSNGERGCPSCAQTGFDPNQNGYVYFLIQPKWEIYQIGISNFPDNRLKSHKKNGFELLELRGPMDGHTAQELETAILRYLKSQNADLSPEHIAGKFDGYSESWTIDSFQVNNLKALIDKTSEAGY